ncbi:FAD-dependent oxidoreductase [Streptomyces sp. NBC_00582]|nr:FAD-dependent oxidoreductase [Streptomyces sp. NBC_00582]WUB61076.1 FAD-dependent oxidoreductase [Streptomyces sp. NBC_00582]
MNAERGVRGSYWIETAPGGDPAPPPTEDVDVEIAVVGGGIAGLSTAWEPARRGRGVAALEADRIAAGATGHTTAEPTALHTLVHDRPRRGRGPDAARPYARGRPESVVREARPFLKQQAQVARHFVGDRLSTVTASAPGDLAPGDGAAVRLGGHPCAVHRDDAGRLRAVSARRTHLGCLVSFNRAEQAWECPCHGSRFAPDGRVLQGPAVRPLKRRDLQYRDSPNHDSENREESRHVPE